jgi:hypothetical protein
MVNESAECFNNADAFAAPVSFGHQISVEKVRLSDEIFDAFGRVQEHHWPGQSATGVPTSINSAIQATRSLSSRVTTWR